MSRVLFTRSPSVPSEGYLLSITIELLTHPYSVLYMLSLIGLVKKSSTVCLNTMSSYIPVSYLHWNKWGVLNEK